MAMQLEELESALRTLGAVLQDRGTPFGLLIVGGGNLLLLGLIDRPTADVDVIGMKDGTHYRQATELPEPLLSAAADVADALGIPAKWINSGPASLMEFGLPLGWEERIEVRHYGALEIHLTSRFDQICFKLYAATDRGPDDKHFHDLVQLRPTKEELLTAAAWTRTHDPSEGFRTTLIGCLDRFGVEADDVAP
jgi:hypothetical protein